MTSTARGGDPDLGPEEARDESRAENRAARDDLRSFAAASPVDEDEQADDDKLELDQTELDELGLTLDDPHQPDPE